MKQFILRNKKAIAGISACLLIGGVTMSFQDTPYVNPVIESRQANDTVPDKFSNHSLTMKELEGLMKNLDIDMSRLEKSLKEIDMDLISKQVELSLKDVDIDKIMVDVEASLSKIDMEKIMADVQLSLTEIDWKEHEGEIKKALEEAKKDMEEARLELKNINKDDIRKEIEDARKDLEKARLELKDLDVDKIRKEANEGIKEARADLEITREMFREMEKDGLVDSKKGFTVEFKNKELFINGVKQSAKVTEKYRKYKDGDFKMKIEKE